jgi:signal transduction histidine kinase/ligand-binding sensor domain-containing protein/DNA-binding response OmpR family regulator
MHIILLLLLPGVLDGMNAGKLRFQHLSEADGLTNSHIHSLVQDGSGFIWIGTENGLYRYDGLKFRHYINYPGDTTSLNSNAVFRLFNDSRNTLWIGTFMGLQYYDKSSEKFIDMNFANIIRNSVPVPIHSISEDNEGKLIVTTDFGVAFIDQDSREMHFVASGSEEAKFRGNSVTAYFIDHNRNHWMGTDAGIDVFNTGTKAITRYNLIEYSKRSFTTTFIHRIYEDNEKNIWVLTREEGVFFKAFHAADFVQFTYRENDKHSLGSNETYDIYEDPQNQIWISTSGGGLNLCLNDKGKFRRIKHSATEKNSLLNNNIRSMLEDRQGNVWIVSYQSGMNIYKNYPQLFRHTDIATENSLDYQSATVCSIFPEGKDKLWIGTDGGGLKLYDRSMGTFKTFLPDREKPGSFPDRVVMTIYKDMQGTLWFGTYQGGLVRYDRSGSRFIAYQMDPTDESTLRSNFVTAILEDSRGNFWIGTNGGGMHLFDRKTGKFISYQNNPDDPNSIVDNFINSILEDHNGNLWVGTFWGLSRYNSRDFTFTNYRSNKSESQSLSHNSVFCLFEDSYDNLWIGTRNGLNKYSYLTDKFTYYTEKDGLSGNTITSILGDEHGNLWISTNNGLTKFEPFRGKMVNFSESDGLQGNEFYRNSHSRASDGEMFFGGTNGFNSFYPDEVSPRENIPNLVLNSMKILEQEVPIGEFTDGRTILKQSLDQTSCIQLRYIDKTFSFEVSAIDFISPENLVIAYKLEGFDKDWNYTSAKYPIITYTNIGAGEYTLLLKAANRNIIDETETAKSLLISIIPPFYRSWWAYLSYILVILSLAYYLWYISIQRIQAQNLVKIEKLKREKSEELNQAKFRFFTNISHEFRTPLTLIIGPLEQMLRNEKEIKPFRNQLDIMLVNARRMLRLINQLLDFRKFEGEKMTLVTEYSDIVRFIGDVMHSFEQYAGEKRISLKFVNSLREHYLWFDADKLDKILFNLLSNAFKFTPPGGSIEIGLETGKHISEPSGEEQKYTLVTIRDTGDGIAEEDLPNLFQRFYQASNTRSFYRGSGLGLWLTKNFVEIHKGKIFVDTRKGSGSNFRIYLPEGDAHLSVSEKQTTDSPGINKYIHLMPESFRTKPVDKRAANTNILLNKPNLLVVEDNIELMEFLESICYEHFNFFGASNGQKGYEMAIDILPDIIISDIMMPEMNGYQFCRKVKHHILTSHIPVVLLTAKSDSDDEIEGYESGADAYIAKPFRSDKLIATANSIIGNRIRLREKFNSGHVLSNQPIRNTADDKFLQKVTDSVNENMTNLEFGVLELSKILGISRVHLHRKLKAIANISPNEFIKNIRLQKAGELLLVKEFNISEVCFRVGFNSPAYFSSCFKNYYQMSPSEYIEKHT